LIDAEPYRQWARDFIALGNNSQSDERGGSIELLDSSMRDRLFSLRLGNVGIVRARMQRAESSSEVLASLDVEMYCESMAFSYEKVAVAQTEPAAAAAPTAPPSSLPTDALLTMALGRNDVQKSIERVRADALATATPELRGKLVAARLQSSAAVPQSEPSRRREDGVAIGERWATENASIGELERVAQLDKAADWTALKLSGEHSLVTQLQAASLIPTGTPGGFELERDEFVEGVIAGASNVLRMAAPHLKPGADA
jgi:hypothetical protein